MQDTNDHLAELFSMYHDTLERYCYRLVHYDPKYRTLAEDAVQIAFLKALQHPELFNASPNPYGWLAVCCKNHIKSKLRQQKNRSKIIGTPVNIDDFHSIENPTDAIARWMDTSAAKTLTDSIYATLTDREKVVFKDYCEQNHSLKETAARNNLSCESVRGAVQRIRSKARKFKLPLMIIILGQCISIMRRTV